MSQEAVMTLTTLEETIRRRRADAVAAGKEAVAKAKEEGERLLTETVQKAESEIAALRQKTETAAMSAAKTVAEQLDAKKSELRANAETKGTDAIKLIVERIVNG